MAEQTPDNTLFFCSADHVGCETVSTDRYKIMCRIHVPVFLFPDARDEMFLTYHYHDVDETHRNFVVYICTRCGENFHRRSLNTIRDHLVWCSIQVPTFLRTCCFCGLGITKKMMEEKKK